MVRGEGRNEFGKINLRGSITENRAHQAAPQHRWNEVYLLAELGGADRVEQLSHRRRCSRSDLGRGLISCLQFERLRLFEGRSLQSGGARSAM
jgi:hypothetical protein